MLIIRNMLISIVVDDNNPVLCSSDCAYFRARADKEAECTFYNLDLDMYDSRYRRESDCVDDFGSIGGVR